jgi:hypothetical protein
MLEPIPIKHEMVVNEGNLSLNPVKISPPAILKSEEEKSLTFNVYRNNNLHESGIPINTYTDEDLSWGTFVYFVTALVDGMESDPSNEVPVDIPPPPPGPPQNLQYEITTDSIHLFWEPPVVGFYDFYKVYRDGSFIENVKTPNFLIRCPISFRWNIMLLHFQIITEIRIILTMLLFMIHRELWSKMQVFTCSPILQMKSS